MGNTVVLTFVGDESKLSASAKRSTAALDAIDSSVKKLDDSFGMLGDGVDKKTGKVGDVLNRFGDNVTDILQKTSDKLPGILGSAIGKLPPQGQALGLAIVGGLATFLIPAIGAAISSAILLALTGGVLAAGIASAFKDDKLAASFEPLKAKATEAFEDFGKPFIEPLYRAIQTFEELIDDLKPFTDKIGEAVAPLIDKIAPAVADFIKNVMPGLTEAIIAGIPLFETLAEHAPGLGKTLSEFFEKVAEVAPAANEFLDDALQVVGWLIEQFGDWIIKTGILYLAMKNFFRNLKNWGKDFWDWLKGLPGRVSDKFSDMGKAISRAFKSAFNSVADAWNSTVGSLSWSVPGWIPGIGGNSISVPNIPRFHSGGTVPGPAGAEMLAILQGGERIVPAASANSASHGETINVTVMLDSDVLVKGVAKGVTRRGGDVQVVLGTRYA